MAEIAEAGEPRAPLPEHGGGHPRIESRGGKAVRALRDPELDDDGAGCGERGGDQERATPGEVGDAADQVGRRRADRERADQDADREPAPLPEPRRHDLHRGRVDAGHADAGHEPEHESGGQALDPERDRRVGEDAERDRGRHEGARRPDVGQVAERAGERAGDEARLDGDGEAGPPAVAEPPLARQRGQDRGGAEPEAERQQLGERQDREAAPGGAHAAATRRRPSRAAWRSPRRTCRGPAAPPPCARSASAPRVGSCPACRRA